MSKRNEKSDAVLRGIDLRSWVFLHKSLRLAWSELLMKLLGRAIGLSYQE